MNKVKNAKIIEIVIDGKESILNALKKMDILERKLLIVINEAKFVGLVSIGDIQRAIIKNLSLETKVSEIIRDDIRVSYLFDEKKNIRAEMIKYRMECMPVLDKNNNLIDVIFWEDIFEEEIEIPEKLNVPVVIMAGGEGIRLKPLTNILPKPLIPIYDKTIIEDIMDQFVNAGCNEFYISLNYKAEMIKQYLLNLNNPAYRIQFLKEDKPLGTAGSLYMLTDKITSSFFVSNCDIIIKQNLSDLYEYHKNNHNDITVVAALKHYEIPYGTIESGVDGLLTFLSEKPELTLKINSGVYLMEPKTLSLIPQDQFFHLTDLILKLKEMKGRIGIFPISEKSWQDYGLIENLPFITKK